ncbi:MAG: hypothetical protein GOU97_02750 [Nanoarchaeota archaeon]|nr:hypothetical protein [Nanoarchaeota archaeon]
MSLEFRFSDGSVFSTEDSIIFSESRMRGIQDYMFREALIQPVESDFRAYTVPDGFLSSEEGAVGGTIGRGEILEEGRTIFKGYLSLTERNGSGRFPRENKSFVHEVLGHVKMKPLLEVIMKKGEELTSLFEEKMNISEQLRIRRKGSILVTDFRALNMFDEAFSRLITLPIIQDSDSSIFDSRSEGYASGTAEVLFGLTKIYYKTGINFLTSTFYQFMDSFSPDGTINFQNSILDIFENESLLEDISLIASSYGGQRASSLFNHDVSELKHKAEKIRDKACFNPSLKQELALNLLENEFGLGKVFPQKFLEQNPEFTERGINYFENRKDWTLFESVKNMKWVYAHACTDTPNHEWGEILLDHLISGVEDLSCLSSLVKNPQFAFENSGFYAGRTGYGEPFVRAILDYDLTLDNLTGWDIKKKAPFVLAYKKLKHLLKKPFSKRVTQVLN